MNENFNLRPDYLELISKAEIQVVKLLCVGKTNKEIAESLYVTNKTVKFHLTNIYKKLGLKNRTQLMYNCYKPLLKQEGDETCQKSLMKSSEPTSEHLISGNSTL